MTKEELDLMSSEEFEKFTQENPDVLKFDEKEMEEVKDNLEEETTEEVESETEEVATSIEGEQEQDKEAPQEEGKDTDTESQDAEVNWQDKYEALMKEKIDLESVLGRQGNELGDLRKQIQELEDSINIEESPDKVEEFNEKFIDAPYQASIEVARKVQETDAKKQQLMDLQQKAYIESNKQYLNERVPDLVELKDDIRAVLEADGLASQEIIESVLVNPYAEDPGIMFQIAARARANKELRELKAKYSDAATKSERILSNVEQATNSSPTINSRTPSAAGSDTVSLSPMEIAKLSPEDTDKLYERIFGKTGG